MNLNILVIDDLVSARNLIKTQLRELNYAGDIVLAESIEAAEEVITSRNLSNDDSKNIDLIISDYNLPGGKDGVSFLKFIRENEKTKSLPFVIITTNNGVEQILAAIEMGANQYLIKPWAKSSLDEKIKDALFSIFKQNQALK
jgi:two-component system chemotaxis response regulator CheY